MIKKFFRILSYSVINFLWYIRPQLATKLYFKSLKSSGVNFTGEPNYISAKVWFDGSDFSKISIGNQVTISSNVRILTHDWSPHTLFKKFGVYTDTPLGILREVSIGDFSFIGTGAIIMPGAAIGKGCLIGAGAVVRGDIPDDSIVIGNPAVIVGDTKDYLRKKFPTYSTVPRT